MVVKYVLMGVLWMLSGLMKRRRKLLSNIKRTVLPVTIASKTVRLRQSMYLPIEGPWFHPHGKGQAFIKKHVFELLGNEIRGGFHVRVT
jgi:hypothetical protein